MFIFFKCIVFLSGPKNRVHQCSHKTATSLVLRYGIFTPILRYGDWVVFIIGYVVSVPYFILRSIKIVGFQSMFIDFRIC